LLTDLALFYNTQLWETQNYTIRSDSHKYYIYFLFLLTSVCVMQIILVLNTAILIKSKPHIPNILSWFLFFSCITSTSDTYTNGRQRH